MWAGILLSLSALLIHLSHAGVLNWHTVPDNETNEDELNTAIYYALDKIEAHSLLPTINNNNNINNNNRRRVHFESLLSVEVRESHIYTVTRIPVLTRRVRLWDPFRHAILYFNTTTYDYQTLPITMDRSYKVELVVRLRPGESVRRVIQKNVFAAKPPDSDDAFLLNLTISKDSQNYFGLTGFQYKDLSSPLISVEVQPVPHQSLDYIGRNRASGSSGISNSDNKNYTTIDIMSVNLWNYNHWDRRKSVLIREILEWKPEIIGFQEVRAKKKASATSSRYQVEDLALLLASSSSSHYHYTYIPAMGWEEGDDHEYVHEGLAIFSIFPILNITSLELSRHEADPNDFHQRFVLHCYVETSIGKIHFLTTHLSLSENARKRTLKEIGEWSQKEFREGRNGGKTNGEEEGVILVGDFNMEMDEANHILKDFGFVDAWKKVHGDEDPHKGWTFNAWELKSRIDYVLLRNLNVQSISVTGEGSDPVTGYEGIAGVRDMKNTMYPSDHRFLLARIER